MIGFDEKKITRALARANPKIQPKQFLFLSNSSPCVLIFVTVFSSQPGSERGVRQETGTIELSSGLLAAIQRP